MFEYELADIKRDQQLKLSLTTEEVEVIAFQTVRHQLASRQDFVKLCISQFLERQQDIDDVDVVFEPDVEIPNRRLERTEGNSDQRAKIDNDLIAFLDNHPESKRSEINEGLMEDGWSNWDVDKSLRRCKKAGKIIRNGETVSATWSATP